MIQQPVGVGVQNMGLATVFNRQQPNSFIDMFVGQEQRVRDRKERRAAELRRYMMEDDTYAPYQQAVNEYLEKGIEYIANNRDVDPAAYTRYVQQYAKRRAQAQQLEEQLRTHEQELRANKLIDPEAAVEQMYSEFVQTGDLEELKRNTTKEIDSRKFIMDNLNPAPVLKDAVQNFGQVMKTYFENGGGFRSAGGGQVVMDRSQIALTMRRIIDPETGMVKDFDELKRIGADQILLSDPKVARVVDDALLEEGIDKRKIHPSRYEKLQLNKLGGMLEAVSDYQRVEHNSPITRTNPFSRDPTSGGRQRKVQAASRLKERIALSQQGDTDAMSVYLDGRIGGNNVTGVSFGPASSKEPGRMSLFFYGTKGEMDDDDNLIPKLPANHTGVGRGSFQIQEIPVENYDPLQNLALTTRSFSDLRDTDLSMVPDPNVPTISIPQPSQENRDAVDAMIGGNWLNKTKAQEAVKGLIGKFDPGRGVVTEAERTFGNPPKVILTYDNGTNREIRIKAGGSHYDDLLKIMEGGSNDFDPFELN